MVPEFIWMWNEFRASPVNNWDQKLNNFLKISSILFTYISVWSITHLFLNTGDFNPLTPWQRLRSLTFEWEQGVNWHLMNEVNILKVVLWNPSWLKLELKEWPTHLHLWMRSVTSSTPFVFVPRKWWRTVSWCYRLFLVAKKLNDRQVMALSRRLMNSLLLPLVALGKGWHMGGSAPWDRRFVSSWCWICLALCCSWFFCLRRLRGSGLFVYIC